MSRDSVIFDIPNGFIHGQRRPRESLKQTCVIIFNFKKKSFAVDHEPMERANERGTLKTSYEKIGQAIIYIYVYILFNVKV